MPMTLGLQRFVDASAFSDRVRPFLAEREAEHNLLFGILDTITRDPTVFDEPPYLAAVDDAGRVVAVALRTPPRSLVLSEIDDPAAIEPIVADLEAAGDAPSGVIGPVAAARSFAELWSARSGRPSRLGRHERVFRLSRVIAPRPTVGTMRLAARDDTELLVAWLTAFDAEAVPPSENAPDPRVTIEGWLRLGTKRNYLWDVAGRPVSWAGVGGRTPNGTRIGPVYTPPPDRGRGYASAVVAAASQAQLDEGLPFCFLFADLANPTANRIYQAIGYEPVTDVDAWYFD
jgi:predicted GNAT family acetyltransferase